MILFWSFRGFSRHHCWCKPTHLRREVLLP